MWLAVIWFVIIIGLSYCVLIIFYYTWFRRLQPFQINHSFAPHTRFSIIIPARNEEANIERCIRSIFENHYPARLYEVIVADDFSTDNTAAVVRELQREFDNLQLIQLADFVPGKINSYKKKSIETAIAHATGEWIVTTDADCEVTEEWLYLFDNFIQSRQPVFVAAPVKFRNNGTVLSIFQCLDFISLQGITAASVSAGFHSMCNGANLAYKKEAFEAVDGFRDVDDIASGDDMLLMHKIQKKYPGGAAYLFSRQATVTTPPMPDVRSFFNQRVRWASKATSYKDKRIFLVLLLVYVFNLALLVLPLAAVFNHVLFAYWVILIILKIYSELIFLTPVARFFRQETLLWWFPFMQPFHIFYTVLSGWLGKSGKYQWKGRMVR